MNNVRLGQLFECTEQGNAFVGEAADGTLVHVDDVPSGLACECRCPGCERRMVARKGNVNAHHFAHHSDREENSCTSPGETALHKFAKKILDARLQIALPEMVVESDNDREVVVQSSIRTFEKAVLEKRTGSVVPDVVLELRDRALIVEFKVTHACDDVKIERIRSMNVGAIEIDLSGYRDRLLNELADDILYNAPRIWLHNPREMDARDRLAERALKRAEALQEEIRKLAARYRHRRPTSGKGSGACETEIRGDGLGALINLEVDGAGCFTVSVAEWQAAIVLEILSLDRTGFRTGNGVSSLRRRRWIHRDFKSIPDDIARGLKEAALSFVTPFEAVGAYLGRLENQGFMRSTPSGNWWPSQSVRQLVENAKDLRERPGKRRQEMRKIVEEQLDGLPEDEKAPFVFDAWINSVLPGHRLSIAAALNSDDSDWKALCRDVAHIRTNIRFSPKPDLDLLGLPCEKELSRSIEQRRLEAEELARRKLEAEQDATTSRISQLRDLAPREIGSHHARVWLASPNDALGALSPLDAAATPDGFASARRALTQKARELDLEERARRQKQKAISELETLAKTKYFNSEHASLWMKSSRRELGGKSPEEFTVDDVTRQQCAALLPAKRSHR